MRSRVGLVISLLALGLWIVPSGVEAAVAFRAAASGGAPGAGTIAFRAAAQAGGGTNTIAFRAAAQAGAASGNLSIAMPTGTVQNDVMVASIAIRPNTATIAAPAGWTLVRRIDNATATVNSLAVYRKVAGAGESGPYLFTLGTNTGSAGGILSFSGVDTTTAIDVENGQNTAGYTPLTPSVTTTVANTMLVTSHGIANSDLWQNPPPSGMTQGFQITGGNEMIQVSWALQAAAGATGTKQATDLGPQTADQGNAHILALRPRGPTSLTISKPTGTVQNDVMVASIGISPSSATITPPAGWTLVRRTDNATANANSLAVYYLVAGASEPASYTWTLSANSGVAGGIMTFSGVDTASPINSENGQITVSGLTHSTPDITPTAANVMLVASYTFSSSATWTTGSGMTEAVDVMSATAGSTGQSTAAYYVAQGPTGATGAKTATASNDADVGNTHLLALRPATQPSLTISKPTGTVQNDVMVATIGFRPNTLTITPPSGWTLVRRMDNANTVNGGAANSLAVYRLVAGASEPASYTWTSSPSGILVGGILSFSGVDTTTPIDVENGQVTPSPLGDTPGLNHDTPSVTTTVANTMLVTSHTYSSAGTWTPPTGMTEAVDVAAGTQSLEANYVLQAAAGATGAKTATAANDADIGNAHILALRPLVCAAVGDASYLAAYAQSGVTTVTVRWSSPTNPVLILRKSTSFTGADNPSNGTDYIVGNSVGGATVVFKGTGGETSFTETGPAASTNEANRYYYKVFPRTGSGASSCYASGIDMVNASPPSGTTPAWSYMMGGGSILKPGIAGTGTIYSSSNASRLTSLSTANGTQSWDPVAANAPIQGWLSWLPVDGYQYRKQITVTAGTAAVPSGYSVQVTLDHASLVTAGKSRANGDDVRAFYWNGTSWVQLDRILDSVSSWNTASAIIWFKTQVAIGAGASDSNYYLYYGNSGATNPPANKANVFLFADDFEAGNLSKWTIVGGLWQIATDRPRSGTYSLKYPAEAAVNQWILANPALNEADVYVDAWWNFSVLDPVNGVPDIAQVFRADASANGYETNFEGQSATREGWDMAKFISGTWTWLNTDTVSTAAANTWTRIGIAISGTGMRIFKEGVQINPATGSFNVGTQLASGNIGFRKYLTGTGAWWIDDVVVRRYVDPEPARALGAEEVLPSGGIVIGGDQSGRVYSVDTAVGTKNWEVLLTGADFIQAPPAAQVRSWSDAAFQGDYSTDVIFVATRNAGATNCGTSTTNNKLLALRADTGAVLWTFNGTCTDGSVNWIVGMPYVDYARNRVYVTSKSDGSQQSLWVIDARLAPATRLVTCPACTNLPPTGLKNVDLDEASPTLSLDGATLYVGNKTGATGNLYAINAADLTLKWTFALGAGVFLKGFVWEEAGKLYFTTSDGYAWCLDASAGAPAAPPGSPAGSCPWKSNDGLTFSPVAPAASTPLLLGAPNPGLYVGSYDSGAALGQKGKLYRINRTTGLKEKQVIIGDGEKQVGDVSTETWTEVFVGTSEGKIFKFPLPLP